MTESPAARIIEDFPHSHAARLFETGTGGLEPGAGHEDFDALYDATEGSSTAQRLAAVKRTVAAAYAHQLTSLATTPEACAQIGLFWSDFADWTLEKALLECAREPRMARLLGRDPEDNATVTGLFILGLGKLGGQDLNYSSDIDLVCFFDAETFAVAPGQGKTDVAGRLMKAVTQTLSSSQGNRVWRVDWRLRPDPSVTGLAMAAAAGLDFHFFHAAPWRRLAMMKARVVAGDLPAGQAFLDELTPFVWRRTLDMRAIEEIAGLKSRIRDEHPGLEGQRGNDTPLAQADGFNVKLGLGGIREIEFVANALQLVWGGREPALRTTNTLQALAALKANGRLEPDEAASLAKAYAFLRGLENRIQLIGDAHEHHYPDGDERECLALLYDSDLTGIEKTLKAHRAFVHDCFSTRFTTAETPDQKAVWEGLEGRALEIVTGWESGFSRYAVPATLADRMRPLEQALMELLAGREDVDDAVQSVERFFVSLPPGGQYLSLLAAYPDLAGDIIPPLVEGGAMAGLLHHSPHVVDLLIQRRGQADVPREERLELWQASRTQRNHETSLEAMRSQINEFLYLEYLRVWRGEESLAQSRSRLTQLAEEALAATLKLVSEEYPSNGTALSIVGFGKLGMGEMMPGSDLDILYLAHSRDEVELEDVSHAHRLAGRLTTALSAEMRGGKIYEIDTRLKPSGSSGAPTVRLETLRRHQMERAASWEHLAFVPARLVTGPDFANEAYSKIRREVLVRPRNADSLAEDSRSMLRLLRENRIGEDQSTIKLLPGGLMEAEFLVAHLTLELASSHPELADLAYRDLARGLEGVSAGLAGLSNALTFLQDYSYCERLHGWQGNPPDEALDSSALPGSAAEISTRLSGARETITSLVTDRILKGKKPKPFDLHPVVWAD